MNTFNIRLANQSDEDVENIARFQMACAMETEKKELLGETVRKGVKHIVSKSNDYYIVAEDENEVMAGCCLLHLQFSDWNNSYYLVLESVYVEASYRGKGLLKTLLTFAEDFAKEHNNISEVRSSVSNQNKTMIKAVEKLGWIATPYGIYGKKLN